MGIDTSSWGIGGGAQNSGVNNPLSAAGDRLNQSATGPTWNANEGNKWTGARRSLGDIGDYPVSQVDVRSDMMKQLESGALPMLLQLLTNPGSVSQMLGQMGGQVPGIPRSNLASMIFGGSGSPQSPAAGGTVPGWQPAQQQQPQGPQGTPSGPLTGGYQPDGSKLPLIPGGPNQGLPTGTPVAGGPLQGLPTGAPMPSTPGQPGEFLDERGQIVPNHAVGQTSANPSMYDSIMQFAGSLGGGAAPNYSDPFSAPALDQLIQGLNQQGAFAGKDALANGMPTQGTGQSLLGLLLSDNPLIRGAGVNNTPQQTQTSAMDVWDSLLPATQGAALPGFASTAAGGGQNPTLEAFLQAIGVGAPQAQAQAPAAAQMQMPQTSIAAPMSPVSAPQRASFNPNESVQDAKLRTLQPGGDGRWMGLSEGNALAALLQGLSVQQYNPAPNNWSSWAGAPVKSFAQGGILDPNAFNIVGDNGPEIIPPANMFGQMSVLPNMNMSTNSAQASSAGMLGNALFNNPEQEAFNQTSQMLKQQGGATQQSAAANPEQDVFAQMRQLLMAQGGILGNGGGGQAVVDAMQPVFTRNLQDSLGQLNRQSPSVFGSGIAQGGTDIAQRAMQDFNLQGMQALQQGQQNTLGAMGLLGQLAGQAGSGQFGRQLAANQQGQQGLGILNQSAGQAGNGQFNRMLGAGNAALQQDLGYGQLGLQAQQQQWNQTVNPTLQLLMAALGMATPTAYQTVIPGKK